MEKFRDALIALYEFESSTGDQNNAQSNERLFLIRLEAIAGFDPLRAFIPSLEEAEAISDSAQTLQEKSQRRLGGGGGLSRGSRGNKGLGALRSNVLASQKMSGPRGRGASSWPDDADSDLGDVDSAASPGAVSAAAGTSAAAAGESVGESLDGEAIRELEIDREDVVTLMPLKAGEFSPRAQQVGQLLAASERSDERIWDLFLETDAEIGELREYARQLTTEGSPTNLAYRAIRGVSQYQLLKKMLDRQHLSQSTRTFDVQVRAFVNTTQRSRKELVTNDRQMAVLDEILDAAGAALLRCEMLKVAYTVAQDPEAEYTEEAIAQYCDTVLASVLEQVDPEVLEAVREKAGEDVRAILEVFAREHFVESVVEQCRAYLEELRQGGHTASLEKVEEAFGETPLEIASARPDEPAGEMPEELQVEDEFGAVFATVCNRLTDVAWAALSPDHEPEAVVARVQAMVRQAMVRHIVVEKSEKRRHADNPRFPLAVVSLGRLSGDPLFKDFYVRVGLDGRIFYADGFEDGTYVDLFELRQAKAIRVQSTGLDHGDQGPLKTGEKYLHSVGRTQQIFGATTEEVVASCLKEEDGRPKVFSVFRRKARP